jgi:hypothetical protein
VSLDSPTDELLEVVLPPWGLGISIGSSIGRMDFRAPAAELSGLALVAVFPLDVLIVGTARRV